MATWTLKSASANMAMPETVTAGPRVARVGLQTHPRARRSHILDDQVASAGVDLREAHSDQFVDPPRIEQVGGGIDIAAASNFGHGQLLPGADFAT
jgi:hypothetical protein